MSGSDAGAASSSLQPLLQPATAMGLLEMLIVPAELDGTRGLYRRPQPGYLLKARLTGHHHRRVIRFGQASQGE